jgi:hypothetical protein
LWSQSIAPPAAIPLASDRPASATGDVAVVQKAGDERCAPSTDDLDNPNVSQLTKPIDIS